MKPDLLRYIVDGNAGGAVQLDSEIEALHNIPIKSKEFDLDSGTRGKLVRGSIETVGQLLTMPLEEVKRIYLIKKRSLEHIQEALKKLRPDLHIGIYSINKS